MHYFTRKIEFVSYIFSHDCDNFAFLGLNLPKKGISGQKLKKWTSPWIQHIRISVSTQFQFRPTILIFWIKISQKEFFQSRADKMNTNMEFSISLSTKFQLKLTIFLLQTNFKWERVFSVENRKNWTRSLTSAFLN